MKFTMDEMKVEELIEEMKKAALGGYVHTTRDLCTRIIVLRKKIKTEKIKTEDLKVLNRKLYML
jgi:hypothetical protein